MERLAPWSREFQKQRTTRSAGAPAPAVPGAVAPFTSEADPSLRVGAPHANVPGNYYDPAARVTAPPLSATPLAPLGESPPTPVPPFLPPTDQRGTGGFGEMPVVPPPVISPPTIAERPGGWEWDSPSGGESPVLIGESPLRDTLPDLPAGLETPSDSDASISLIVEPPRRMPLWLLMALVLTPVVLAGVVLLALWLRDAASGMP